MAIPNIIQIAHEVVSDMTKRPFTGNILFFHSPVYFAITADDEIEDSSLPFILKTAHIAVIVLGFDYGVITQTDFSQYVIFIDENGIPNDKIRRGKWTLSIIPPRTGMYRTYRRCACISDGVMELQLPMTHSIERTNFANVWKIFSKTTDTTTHADLGVLAELYKSYGTCPEGYEPRVSTL